jgi:hypothetical protein
MSRASRAPRTDLKDAHLVRFDTPRASGWQVRLPLWHPLSGERGYTEFFADGSYGGESESKRAARRRRDELFAQERLSLRLRGATTNKLNTTGLVGVGLGFDVSAKGEGAFFWIAHWSDEDGTKRRKRFHVGVHGFESALEQAECRWIAALLGLSRGQPRPATQ